MGNYRQHLAFGTSFGVIYSLGAALLAGLHWAYASIAVLISMLGGLLPDLDSPSSVQLRGMTGILGLLSAIVVWRSITRLENPPGFEYHLWAMLAAYIAARHGLRRFMVLIAVHRGMSHSVPTGASWAALTYLVYPSEHHAIRLAMATAMFVGFMSHLILDEICSVDIQGARVNKAFGTALKFWAQSAVSTVFVYLCLSFLCWRVIKVWPEDEGIPANLRVEGPAWPYPWPKSWVENNFKEVRDFASDQLNRLPGRIDQAKAAASEELKTLPDDLARVQRKIATEFPETVAEGSRLIEESASVQKAQKALSEAIPRTVQRSAKRLGDSKTIEQARKTLVDAIPKAVESAKKVAREPERPSIFRRR